MAANDDANFEGPSSVQSRQEHDGLTLSIIDTSTRPGDEEETTFFNVSVKHANEGDETIPMPSDAYSAEDAMTYGPNLSPTQSYFADNALVSVLPGQLVPGSDFVADYLFEIPSDEIDNLRLYLNLDSNQYSGWTFTDVESTTYGEKIANDLPPFEDFSYSEGSGELGGEYSDQGAAGGSLKNIESEWAALPEGQQDFLCMLWNDDPSGVIGPDTTSEDLSEAEQATATAFLNSKC